jgi:23S rRNA (adenine2030-N6)-methyltransferase
MFSYRHAFHAGNHADVLKHSVLIAILNYLGEKDTALMLLDTHAGAGLYRLDGDYANTSGEAKDGVLRLLAPQKTGTPTWAPLLQAYVDLVRQFNPSGSVRVYPGSPFIIQQAMRERDRLKLFEVHPTDAKTLSANIAQLDAGRSVAVLREDGFAGVRKFLPPPSRRGLMLCDPSYEMKTDYRLVADTVADALQRFATGTYAVWYPIIPRPEAHDLPKKLRTLSQRSGKPWLHATLTVKNSKLVTDTSGNVQRPGLPASGMFVINPPFTLKAALQEALPQLVQILGQDEHAAFGLESGS